MMSSFYTTKLCPTLVGRSAELAALQQLVEQTVKGRKDGERRGQLALLCGEAGIGKSRLVAETKKLAVEQGFQVLQGQCFPTDITCPYAPFLDLLRKHSPLLLSPKSIAGASSLEALLRELSPLLPHHLVPPINAASVTRLEPEQEKRRLFSAMADLFTYYAQQQPVLLIIEDVHWSDDTSLEFLHYLARRSIQDSLLLLITYRSDEMRPTLDGWLAQVERERLAQELTLTCLSRDDTNEMLNAILALQRPMPAESLDAIYTLTEGNPFFIEEILSTITATTQEALVQTIWSNASMQELRMPRSIAAAVQQRIAQLSPAARELLALAAIAGRRFDFTVLQQIMGCNESQLLQLMKELLAAQLVIEESAEVFAFRHALTRQTIYNELLVRERQSMHSTIARTIEQLYSTTSDERIADLAYHYYEAEEWEKCAFYAQRAGEKALALYAAYAAVELLTQAIEARYHLAPTHPSSHYALRFARGQAFDISGDFERTRADYEAALQQARSEGNAKEEWQVLLALGMLWTGRDYERSGEYYEQAYTLARHINEPHLLARTLNRVGNWHLNLEHPQEALAYHQEALAIFQGLNEQHGIAETLDLLGMASYLSGDLVCGTEYYQQAVLLFQQLSDRQGLTSSLATLTMRGATYQTDTLVSYSQNIAEAIPDGEQALSIARETGQHAAQAYALIFLGFCLGAQGEYTRALECAQAGLGIAEEIEHRQWITAACCALGVIYRDMLIFAQARRYLHRALKLAEESCSLHWQRCAAGHLASTYVLQRDFEGAINILATVLDDQLPAQTIGQRLIWVAKAELELAQRSYHSAIAILEKLITVTSNVTDERHIPRLLRLYGEALAQSNEHEKGELMLQRAQTIAMRQGTSPMLWRTGLSLGRLYQRQRRYDEAEQALQAASALVEELAATIHPEELQSEFLRTAQAQFPAARALSTRRATRNSFGGLTEREREIAVLIAQGKSSREMASSLIVSERTIETHVGNILAKLSFNARTQIAAWAVEKGLLDTSK